MVEFVAQLLTNRRTRLRFDNYISEYREITNGIGQGDPLSMLLYILYNADLLEIPDDNSQEDTLGYVDDIALIASGNTFEESTQRLKNMMTKEDGGLQWSIEHNSKFEVSKSAIIHLTRKTIPDPETNHGHLLLEKPKLILDGQEVKGATCFKYLGIQIDVQL